MSAAIRGHGFRWSYLGAACACGWTFDRKHLSYRQAFKLFEHHKAECRASQKNSHPEKEGAMLARDAQ